MSGPHNADDVSLFPITPFCIPGQHPHDKPTGNILDGAALPESWILIRARFVPELGQWVNDPFSPAKIMCCPEHVELIGEIE